MAVRILFASAAAIIVELVALIFETLLPNSKSVSRLSPGPSFAPSFPS